MARDNESRFSPKAVKSPWHIAAEELRVQKKVLRSHLQPQGEEGGSSDW